MSAAYSAHFAPPRNKPTGAISDAIFPSRDSQDVALHSKGGEARIVKLEVWTLRSAWR